MVPLEKTWKLKETLVVKPPSLTETIDFIRCTTRCYSLSLVVSLVVPLIATRYLSMGHSSFFL